MVGKESFNYDQSKANAEKLIIEACGKGLNAVILNPSSVVGPNDYVPSLVGQLILQIAKGNMPFLIKGGYHWVDVRDVADAAINAIDRGRIGERYLLTSQYRSLRDISQLICKPEKRKIPMFIPYFLAWLGLPFINLYSLVTGKKALYTSESPSIVSHSPNQVNNIKAINELGFKPRPVEETFSDSLQWFKNNGYLK